MKIISLGKDWGGKGDPYSGSHRDKRVAECFFVRYKEDWVFENHMIRTKGEIRGDLIISEIKWNVIQRARECVSGPKSVLNT